MRHVSHRYQVRVTQLGRHGRPTVEGFEAINVNGDRRVRYWDGRDPVVPRRWFEGGFSSLHWPGWFDLDADTIEAAWTDPSLPPRRIRVEVQEAGHDRQTAPDSGWS
jgi:hypothetical protein